MTVTKTAWICVGIALTASGMSLWGSRFNFIGCLIGVIGIWCSLVISEANPPPRLEPRFALAISFIIAVVTLGILQFT
jgi:hypothetical protein